MAYSGKKLLSPLATMTLATTTAIVVVLLLFITPPCAAQPTAEEEAVAEHNKARAAVSVTPVSWNDTLAEYADAYAAQRQGDCQLVHSGGPYGENLFRGPGTVTDYTAAGIVGKWVAEKQYYDHDSNSCAAGQECDHYTQVVWGTTTSIGCSLVECSNGGGVFVICSYYPAGNVDGQSPY